MDEKKQICPNCGGNIFDEEGSYYITSLNKYIAVRCSTCGAVNRKKESQISGDKHKNLLFPAAR